MIDNTDLAFLQQPISLSFAPTMALEGHTFPFSCVLSLEPLIHFWQRDATSEKIGRRAVARSVLDALEQAPALRAPIEDLALITQHRELLDLLMSPVFPAAFWERDYGAAYVPDQFRSFYATPAFAKVLMAPDGTLGDRMHTDSAILNGVQILRAYVDILRKFYGITLAFAFPHILTATHPVTGLERHFKLHFSRRFLEVQQHGGPQTLSRAAQKHLLENVADLRVWMDILPPEYFAFQGFTVVNAMDVTDQEVLSALKHDVVGKVSMISETPSWDLQGKLRTLLGLPHLMLGLVAVQGQQVFVLKNGSRDRPAEVEHSPMAARYRLDDLPEAIYDQAITHRQMMLIEDLTMLPQRSPLETAFFQYGMRNLLVVPLYDQDTLIGLLTLGSPNPGDFHALNTMQLQEVLPLFSIAVQRSMEELDARIQRFIKEQYTAVHAAVEWRFRQAALQVLQRQSSVVDMEPIVFQNVYPLYAMSDVRGASTKRNEAIRADTTEHLCLAEAVLSEAYAYHPMPVLDELKYRVNKYIGQLARGLNAGDEEAILDFLRQDVDPIMDHLQEFHSRVRERVQEYRRTIDPHLGIVYQRRRDFEESVTRLNETISTYLDTQEAIAQNMFSHYFEKHTSDGVEHGMYIGAALVEDGKFDVLYLHNLRLWQLLIMCGSALLTAQMHEELAVPLEMTHLVLAHHTPLSIRFHPDEKQFEVDGAYNMRYEVIKRRIDKVCIKGTGERLTQPNTIAIVYSQPREALEYRAYIAYLQNKGYVTAGLEELDLDDLQEAHGLKALRVTVNMQAAVPGQEALHTALGNNGSATTAPVTVPHESQTGDEAAHRPAVSLAGIA